MAASMESVRREYQQIMEQLRAGGEDLEELGNMSRAEKRSLYRLLKRFFENVDKQKQMNIPLEIVADCATSNDDSGNPLVACDPADGTQCPSEENFDPAEGFFRNRDWSRTYTVNPQTRRINRCIPEQYYNSGDPEPDEEEDAPIDEIEQFKILGAIEKMVKQLRNAVDLNNLTLDQPILNKEGQTLTVKRGNKVYDLTACAAQSNAEMCGRMRQDRFSDKARCYWRPHAAHLKNVNVPAMTKDSNGNWTLNEGVSASTASSNDATSKLFDGSQPKCIDRSEIGVGFRNMEEVDRDALSRGLYGKDDAFNSDKYGHLRPYEGSRLSNTPFESPETADPLLLMVDESGRRRDVPAMNVVDGEGKTLAQTAMKAFQFKAADAKLKVVENLESMVSRKRAGKSLYPEYVEIQLRKYIKKYKDVREQCIAELMAEGKDRSDAQKEWMAYADGHDIYVPNIDKALAHAMKLFLRNVGGTSDNLSDAQLVDIVNLSKTETVELYVPASDGGEASVAQLAAREILGQALEAGGIIKRKVYDNLVKMSQRDDNTAFNAFVNAAVDKSIFGLGKVQSIAVDGGKVTITMKPGDENKGKARNIANLKKALKINDDTMVAYSDIQDDDIKSDTIGDTKQEKKDNLYKGNVSAALGSIARQIARGDQDDAKCPMPDYIKAGEGLNEYQDKLASYQGIKKGKDITGGFFEKDNLLNTSQENESARASKAPAGSENTNYCTFKVNPTMEVLLKNPVTAARLKQLEKKRGGAFKVKDEVANEGGTGKATDSKGNAVQKLIRAQLRQLDDKTKAYVEPLTRMLPIMAPEIAQSVVGTACLTLSNAANSKRRPREQHSNMFVFRKPNGQRAGFELLSKAMQQALFELYTYDSSRDTEAASQLPYDLNSGTPLTDSTIVFRKDPAGRFGDLQRACCKCEPGSDTHKCVLLKSGLPTKTELFNMASASASSNDEAIAGALILAAYLCACQDQACLEVTDSINSDGNTSLLAEQLQSTIGARRIKARKEVEKLVKSNRRAARMGRSAADSGDDDANSGDAGGSDSGNADANANSGDAGAGAGAGAGDAARAAARAAAELIKDLNGYDANDKETFVEQVETFTSDPTQADNDAYLAAKVAIEAAKRADSDNYVENIVAAFP